MCIVWADELQALYCVVYRRRHRSFLYTMVAAIAYSLVSTQHFLPKKLVKKMGKGILILQNWYKTRFFAI
ncbi:MAG: hypothetical protein V7L14_20195 [Nostoc sp.]|uniref:hypothetical protein n=1 Tax=Nostoc sp. TaxID=1180 RepID=UPI002FF75631